MSSLAYAGLGRPQTAMAAALLSGPFVEIHVGPQNAFNTLYKANQGPVLAAIRRLLKARDRLRRQVDDEEEVWLAVLKALRRGDTFADEGALIRFLRQVVKDRWKMEVRARVGTQKRSMNHEATRSDARQAAAKGSSLARRAEAKDYILTRLSALPIHEREIMVWLPSGWTAKEIARSTGLSLEAVKRCIDRVMRRWRRDLRREEGCAVKGRSMTVITVPTPLAII